MSSLPVVDSALKGADGIARALIEITTILEELERTSFILGDSVSTTTLVPIITVPRGNPVATMPWIFTEAHIKGLRIAVDEFSSSFYSLQEIARRPLISFLLGDSYTTVTELPHIEKILNSARQWLSLWQGLTGTENTEGFRRILVLFQNEDEIRATGGFMGAIAEITFLKGVPSQIYFPQGGPYDLMVGPQNYRVAPEGLTLTRNALFFHDANWWPHFSQSAEEIARLYRETTGGSVDGIIAINSGMIPSLLKITGPLQMSKDEVDRWNLPSEINEKNVFSVMTQTEINQGKESPKAPLIALLRSAGETVGQKINQNPPETVAALLTWLQWGVTTKEIQMWAANPVVQAEIREFNAEGGIDMSAYDSFGFVISSVGGGKSSRLITDKVTREIKMLDTSWHISTTLERNHRGLQDSDQEVSWIRFFVPSGAQDIHLEGSTPPALPWFADKNFTPPFGVRTPKATFAPIREVPQGSAEPKVVGAWVILKPGEKKQVTLTYTLPPSPLYPETKIWNQSGRTPTVITRVHENFPFEPFSPNLGYVTLKEWNIPLLVSHANVKWRPKNNP